MDFNPYEQSIALSNQTFKEAATSIIPTDTMNTKLSRRRSNSLRLLNKKQQQSSTNSIIKPIALRPNQINDQSTENPTDTPSQNIKSTKFTSIDKINEVVKRRNSISSIGNHLDSNSSSSSSSTDNLTSTINSSLFNNYDLIINNQPQRPHLNFIKMKLQQIRIAQSHNHHQHQNTENQKFLFSFSSLDLNNSRDDLRNSRKLLFASNSSLFSSLSSSSSIRTELDESDLDLAQIESDLNY